MLALEQPDQLGRRGQAVQELERRAKLKPVLVAQLIRLTLLDEGVEDQLVFAQGSPEAPGAGLERGDDGSQAVGMQVVRQPDGGFVEGAAAELEEVSGTVLGFQTVDGGIGIGAEREEGEAGEAQAVCVLGGGEDEGVGEVGFFKHGAGSV